MLGITGDKMLSHLDRVVGDHKPITADVFLTNYCNNSCPYCTYRRWNLEDGAYSMSYDEFVLYAERLLSFGVQGIILTGGGEPTVCRDFEKITSWMESQGIHYGINTNFNRMVRIKPDYLKVSLDGWDEDSYAERRGVRHYQLARKNIQAYAAWKRENSPGTSLGIQCVVKSVEDVEKFFSANRDLDVDYIVFRPEESTGGKAYAGESARASAAEIIQAVNNFTEIDSRVVCNFKWHLLGVQERDCVAAWSQIAMNERGGIMFCCHKPYQVLGHIMDEDILEKKAAAVTDMRTCDVPCRLTAPNAFVASTMAERKDACFL